MSCLHLHGGRYLIGLRKARFRIDQPPRGTPSARLYHRATIAWSRSIHTLQAIDDSVMRYRACWPRATGILQARSWVYGESAGRRDLTVALVLAVT